jgi:hypothetical protein
MISNTRLTVIDTLVHASVHDLVSLFFVLWEDAHREPFVKNEVGNMGSQSMTDLPTEIGCGCTRKFAKTDYKVVVMSVCTTAGVICRFA